MDFKTKPGGVLGQLEDIAMKIGCIQNTLAPRITKPLVIVFAGDHGAAIFGISPLLGLSYKYGYQAFGGLVPLLLLLIYPGRYFNKWIDGYTGDCLGTIQQLSEVLILLYMLTIWKFI